MPLWLFWSFGLSRGPTASQDLDLNKRCSQQQHVIMAWPRQVQEDHARSALATCRRVALANPLANRHMSRKGFCRNPRGIYPTEFPGEFCRGFFSGFFRAFSLEKNRGKNPPKNPRKFSNQNLGVSGPKSTLQGSGLEHMIHCQIRTPTQRFGSQSRPTIGDENIT